MNRAWLCGLAGATLVALGVACGGDADDSRGVLVAVLDVRGTPDVSMPLHVTVEDEKGRQVEDGALHNDVRPLTFLLSPGSYRLAAMPGCSYQVTVTKDSIQNVAVMLNGNQCSVIPT